MTRNAEDLCCDLTLAEMLKEKGYPQGTSYFVHYLNKETDENAVAPRFTVEPFHPKMIVCDAPTVDELEDFINKNADDFDRKEENQWVDKKKGTYFNRVSMGDIVVALEKKYSDAMAQLVLYLIDQEVIKVRKVK